MLAKGRVSTCILFYLQILWNRTGRIERELRTYVYTLNGKCIIKIIIGIVGNYVEKVARSALLRYTL